MAILLLVDIDRPNFPFPVLVGTDHHNIRVHINMKPYLVVTLCNYVLVLLVNPITESDVQFYTPSSAASSAIQIYLYVESPSSAIRIYPYVE